MKFAKINIIVGGWLIFITAANAAKILAIFPMAAKSHFQCNEAMMRSLHDAGHEITFISPFPNHESMTNYTVIDSNQDTFVYIGQNSLNEFRDMSKLTMLEFLLSAEEKYCRDVLQLPEVQSMLNSTEKLYDVMFLEIMSLYECFLPLAEKFNIPVIGTVTLRSWQIADAAIGNSYNPAIIPVEIGSYSDQMTFVQRLKNVWDYLIIQYHYYVNIKPVLNQLHEDFYTSDLLHKKKISLVFNNNHPSIMPRSLVPNAIEIGGVHVKPANPLPTDLHNFIDEAEYGVILFTFGSVMKSSTMPPEMKIAFKEAFARIPQRVIWKFEEEIENLSKNVFLMNWVPQRDILAHKNVKAFITHSGISGIYEAVHEGVPLVMTPLFGDQESNAAILEKLEVGVYLNIFTATTETILDSLNAVLNDTRYYNNMRKLSQSFKDRPMSPQQTVTYWTEYVIRNNGAIYLRTAGAEMPLYRYSLLDIGLFVIVITFLATYATFWLINKVYNFYFESSATRISAVLNKKKM